ncbi:DUF2927 domain-containing protein [Aestuariibaculum sp. YM273]|uniref:DUF2927 domain-containing protein n=1 Tax=Aestuariibaculum sp. YM273 TaxID=3070659 RepID=UPI0027DE6FC0|nr:DUF2927 domain-containing protein [Aestuariibaculum sp. YM273]WMI64137.1 DUF2927 domain-containing protein [Aestuariibaculum sp. YM273]
MTLLISCSQDEDALPEPMDNETRVINYFKEIALGFEYGNLSHVTRKWTSDMRVFVSGAPSSELISELDRIIAEINDLATDGFQITVVNDSLQSNYHVFFGRGMDYAEIYPSLSNFVINNSGLFTVSTNSQNQLTRGHMYVDIEREQLNGQKHLLREELTQSLGLAQDSYWYPDSIFQSEWTVVNEYTSIDRELIRLLYHPDMTTGLDEDQVDGVLREILNVE